MMAQAGVTTFLDMSSPADSVMDIAMEHGVGLNVARIEYVRAGRPLRHDGGRRCLFRGKGLQPIVVDLTESGLRRRQDK